jgi:hypothetical protein
MTSSARERIIFTSRYITLCVPHSSRTTRESCVAAYAHGDMLVNQFLRSGR